jgi:hypothetical protein
MTLPQTAENPITVTSAEAISNFADIRDAENACFRHMNRIACFPDMIDAPK